MVFMGHGLNSQESGSVFGVAMFSGARIGGSILRVPGNDAMLGAAVCKIQARKHVCQVQSYYQYQKIKDAASLKVKALLYSCLLIGHLPSRSRIHNGYFRNCLVLAQGLLA